MSDLWQLMYQSAQAYEMESGDMLKLLLDAREHNHQRGITGLLLYHGGRFMQLLEGNQSDVQGLYRKISADSRHSDPVLEINAPASQRLFPDWHMGFAEVPQLRGRAVMSGVESERDAQDTLRLLSRDHLCAMRMLRFLREQDDNGTVRA